MKEDLTNLTKIFSTKGSLDLKKVEKRGLQGLRLSSFNLCLKRPAPAKIRSKQMKKISTDLFHNAKPIPNCSPVYQAAFDTYRCSQQQGLHLLDLKRNYEEKCHPLRKAKRWSLHEAAVARSYLRDIQSVKVVNQTKHTIKKINEKSSPSQQSS